MKNILIAALLGGLVLFIWGFALWLVFSFHEMTIDSLPGGEDAAVELGIRESGLYIFPGFGEDPEYSQEIMSTGPVISILVYRDHGIAGNMGTIYAGGFALNLLTALLMAFILSKAASVLKSFGSGVSFVVLVGSVPALSVFFANWNWWGYPLDYTLSTIFDHLSSFALLGCVLAWRIKPE